MFLLSLSAYQLIGFVIGAIIIIRWKQMARQLEGIGISRFLFLTGLAVFLFYIIFKQLGIESNHYFVTAGFILLVLSVHLQRTDKELYAKIENRSDILIRELLKE